MFNANSSSDYVKKDSTIKRRKSDSNLLQDTQKTNFKRNSQMAQQVNKTISTTLAERQLNRLKKDDAPQEDTFYRALEIKFHHSVGSMSISPACRDVVLAG
jgi:hypothetical protein